MTDYLTALATRALAPREVLQPRVAGRFEPVGENVAAASESVAPRVDVAESRSSVSLVGEKSPPDPHSPLPSMREWRRDAATPAGETPVLQSPALPVPALTAPPMPLRETGTEGPELRSSVIRHTDNPRSPITIERRIVDDVGDAAAPPHAPARETKLSEPITRILTRDRVTPPRVIERLRLRREQSMIAQDAQPPVEITIGRIDVRAVVAAQSPAPKAKPQPRILSLDEYAAKRDGRNR